MCLVFSVCLVDVWNVRNRKNVHWRLRCVIVLLTLSAAAMYFTPSACIGLQRNSKWVSVRFSFNAVESDATPSVSLNIKSVSMVDASRERERVSEWSNRRTWMWKRECDCLRYGYRRDRDESMWDWVLWVTYWFWAPQRETWHLHYKSDSNLNGEMWEPHLTWVPPLVLLHPPLWVHNMWERVVCVCRIRSVLM
jgi:hypothetical protein